MNRSLIVLFLFTLLSLSTSSFPSTCIPHFPLTQGWLGADAAYSIPLPDGRVVWIFGDTLYGDKRAVHNGLPRMTHNSIGISTCDNGVWNIDYTIKSGSEGHPESFFSPKNEDTWYWALDGVYYNEELWVTLLCLELDPTDTTGAFGFKTCGSDLARVSNLEQDPQKWSVTYYPLARDGVGAYPSSAATIEGDYLYIFALYEKGEKPMILVRIPLDKLEQAQESMQYLSKDNSWKQGLAPEDAKAVMEKGNSEMSVKYHPERKEWIAIHNNMDFWYADEIIYKTAPKIEGPWTKGTVIHHIEDVQRTNPKYDQDTFCYAGKEHPEFSQEDEMLITYTCNTYKAEKLQSNLDIYFPKAIKVPFPKKETIEM